MNATIVVLGGDGIGPEVTREAVRVLQAVADAFGHEFHFVEHLIGGCAIDAHGTALPDETLAACQQADAVLLGAVGGPKWDDPTAPVRPEQGLLGLRKALGLFANLRPVTLFPALVDASPLKRHIVEGVNLVVVRELTGGIYFGPRQEPTDGTAYDTMLYTGPEVARVVRLAGEIARRRRRRVTSVDKANVLASSRLWRHVVTHIMAEEFPDVQLEHLLVDAAAMHLLRRPADFDVIVTGNMFGDILTDEAAMLAGSLGMLPSASLGESGPGLYEPVHGSAPDIAGQGIANPIGAILSAALLLRYSLNLEQEARCVEEAVRQALAQGLRTADIARPNETPVATEVLGTQVADLVPSSIAKVDQ
ncbi:MAG: 3-isopropylmalate dehydrogenase [Ardenticatenia bacterium]|nr:3-isopropylmalate dehydrogenase [Ardenticatenia bacterium]